MSRLSEDWYDHNWEKTVHPHRVYRREICHSNFQGGSWEAREVARQITKAVSAQDTHKGAEKYSTQSDTLGKKRFKTVRAYHSEDMK